MAISAKQSNTKLAQDFVDHFGLPEEQGDRLVITVDQFDSWAKMFNYYSEVNVSDKDALNAGRNNLRGALNNVARGDVWRNDEGQSSFAVEVLDHGKTYSIFLAMQGMISAGHKLPRKVESIARTRHSQLKALLDAADFSTLPPELKIEASVQVDRIDEWRERQTVELNQMERGFRRLRHRIEEEVSRTNPSGESEAMRVIQNHNEEEHG